MIDYDRIKSKREMINVKKKRVRNSQGYRVTIGYMIENGLIRHGESLELINRQKRSRDRIGIVEGVGIDEVLAVGKMDTLSKKKGIKYEGRTHTSSNSFVVEMLIKYKVPESEHKVICEVFRKTENSIRLPERNMNFAELVNIASKIKKSETDVQKKRKNSESSDLDRSISNFLGNKRDSSSSSDTSSESDSSDDKNESESESESEGDSESDLDTKHTIRKKNIAVKTSTSAQKKSAPTSTVTTAKDHECAKSSSSKTPEGELKPTTITKSKSTQCTTKSADKRTNSKNLTISKSKSDQSLNVLKVSNQHSGIEVNQKKQKTLISKLPDNEKIAVDNVNNLHKLVTQNTEELVQLKVKLNTQKHTKLLHEKAISDAESEYEKATSDSKSEYEKTISDAKAKYDKTLSDAKTKRDKTLSDSQSQIQSCTQKIVEFEALISDKSKKLTDLSNQQSIMVSQWLSENKVADMNS